MSSFRDNIRGVDFADTQSLSKLLCTIDLLSKYVLVFPLKDKRGISIVNAFQKITSKGPKPNKIWVEQRGEFYNNLFKRFLKINNIDMLNDIAGLFLEKTLKQKHLCRHDKNYYCFRKSNVHVINLIVDSRNMIKVSKNMSL